MESSKAVKKDYNELSLSDIFMYLFKYRIIIIVCIIAGAAAGVLAFIRQKQQAPVLSYYAKATMIVTSKNVEGSYQASGSPDYASASDIYFAQTLVLSTAELAKSNYVLILLSDNRKQKADT